MTRSTGAVRRAMVKMLVAALCATSFPSLHAQDKAGFAVPQFGVGAFMSPTQLQLSVLDPAFYQSIHTDLRGMTPAALQSHWLNHGLREGRQPRADFDLRSYLARYPDVKQSVGDNYAAALEHYFRVGTLQGRTADPNKPYPPGVLVRGPGGAISLIDGEGKSRWVVSMDVFTGCALNGLPAQDLTSRSVDLIPKGANLASANDCRAVLTQARTAADPLPAGTLLRDPTGRIYVMDASRNRRWINSYDVYSACGLVGQPTQDRAQANVDVVPQGAVINTVASCRTLLDSIGFTPAAGTVRVRNSCSEGKAIAIKNDENGQYQRLFNNATDAQIAPGQIISYPVSGRRFYAHFSGLTHLVSISTQFAADTERDLELRQEGGNCVIRVRSAAGASASASMNVNITNMCGEAKSIAIKNDDNGVYQKLDGEKTDVDVPPSATRRATLQGTRFYAHFSSLAHLSNIATQFTAPNSELMLRREGGNCVIRAGSMTASAEAQAVQIRVVNGCMANGSIAIKSNTSGDYQPLADGGRTDLLVETGKSRDVVVYGREFWVHWSGRTDLGVVASGPGVVTMAPGGTPCRLVYAPVNPQNQVGTYRIQELRSTARDQRDRARHAATVAGRLIEIYNVPGATATPAEQALIQQLETEITAMRVATADYAIAAFDVWYKKAEQEAALRNDKNLLGLHYWGTKPPDSFKRMALSGVPILNDDDARSMQQILNLVGGMGGTVLGGLGGAALGSLATGLVTTIFPFAGHVAVNAASVIATGITAGAGAGAIIVATAVIGGLAIADIIAIETYRPDLVKVRDGYANARFNVAAASRSDFGRKQLLLYLSYLSR